MVSSLLCLRSWVGGGGVLAQAYVSFADLQITMNEEFLWLIFWSKRVCLGLNYAQRPENSMSLAKSVCNEVFAMKIKIFIAYIPIFIVFWGGG